MIFAPDLLRDRVAIVTGGGTGIGRGIAVELARAGACLALAGRRPAPLEAAAAEITSLGCRCLVVPTDVRDWNQAQAMVARVIEEYGRIDILVNSAGGQFPTPFEQMSAKGWQAVIDLNLNGVFHCIRAAASEMITQKHGKIVNIITGFPRRAAPNMAHSGAARAAVENLTRTLAIEWAKYNIQINCISPIVLTDALADALHRNSEAIERLRKHIPAGRFGRLEEIGWLVTYLVSPAGDFITGEHILIDGGYWLATPIGLDDGFE